MWPSTICCQFALGEVSLSQKPFTRATVRSETFLFASGQVKLYERVFHHIYILLTETTLSDCELQPTLRQHSKCCVESPHLIADIYISISMGTFGHRKYKSRGEDGNK